MSKLVSVILAFLAGIFPSLHAPQPDANISRDNYAVVSPAPGTSNISGSKAYTDAELLALADNSFANGIVPLGDNKYTTDAPKKGYIYLCRVNGNMKGGGAGVDGPWITGLTWNYLEKISVSGSHTWSNASFADKIAGASRLLTGNGLPISHPTGTFPVAATDSAYRYDRNPNAVSAQSLRYTLPVTPVYADTPTCMGGEVGIMLTGVPLFNGFDAEYRDAPAHELQDKCDGHPEKTGQYHYHSLSSCFGDISVKTVLGFALDGFPITGPVVADGKYLTSSDLDECHGITSEIMLDGVSQVSYHYVMTRDFPYSVSCFRGHPQDTKPGMTTQAPDASGAVGTPSKPPAEALTACSGKSANNTCSFTTPRGSVTGTCRSTPDGSFACIPASS